MRACVMDSHMELPESDVIALALAVYEEALYGCTKEDILEGITFKQLKKVFAKYPGLIENLTFRYVYDLWL